MWKHLNINKQNIKTETDKAILIACPHKSKYNGFVFWHPRKLMKNSLYNTNAFYISYTDDFVFRLKKYGKGKYNSYDIIEEKEITPSEIESAFYMMENEFEPEEPEIYTPEHLEPEHATVEESLIDNE